MADMQKTQETYQPPAYPTPMPMPMPVPVPVASPAYPLKYETSQFNQNQTVPAPVPPTVAGRQYQEHLFAACARGDHERTTQFGLCGIIAAICLFPCGLLCLFADMEHRCARCGIRLN